MTSAYDALPGGGASRNSSEAFTSGELARIATQDLALEDEESAPGVRGVAVPVRDYQRRVVGAVGVLGPVLRLTLERLQGELTARTRTAGQNISKRLGYAVVPA